MNIVAINEAEAVIDPFWDENLSGLPEWTITPGASHGLRVTQFWCWVAFEWVRRPSTGLALQMRREFGLDCSDYDRLVLSVAAPFGAVVRMTAGTDRGERAMTSEPAGSVKAELALDLAGALRLDSVTIEIQPGSDGAGYGWFNWLGLQSTERLARKRDARTVWDPQWPKHLKAPAFEPSFTPQYGFLLDSGELELLRIRHKVRVADGSRSPFEAAGKAANERPPEDLIDDFVNFWDDTRYNRVRDHGKTILSHGLNAAIAGHLLKDKSLLRLAARYALSIGMCTHWDDGFICRYPGSTFEHRCFVQSLCAFEVAGILDLAGECFTPLGRDFLLRRLAEEGVGAIQYATWRHPYIFDWNQLSWFSPGRVLALSVLSRQTSRVRPYLDIAYAELCENLDNTILPDGGFVEGPMYFTCVGRFAGLALRAYSRATGKPLAELAPDSMRRCANFAEVFCSTDDAQDVVPISDSRPRHDVLSLATMAALLPGSPWQGMVRKSVERSGGWPMNPIGNGSFVPLMADSALAWSLDSGPPAETAPLKVYVALPEMGPIVSHRKLAGHQVKIFIQGSRANAGHSHEDKGSFALEYAGETYAMDPGICDYSHPLAGELKTCQRHNMLAPYGLYERPAPESPLRVDVKPHGHGDECQFNAEIDATPGYERYFRKWLRAWASDAPERLTITDEYELTAGDGVEFYWQTRLPIELDGQTATVRGKKSSVAILAPPDCLLRVDEFPLPDSEIQRRLTIRKPGTAGALTVSVRLYPIR